MLTTDASRFYGTPILIRECRDARDLEAAIKRVWGAVKPGERVVLVAFRREET